MGFRRSQCQNVPTLVGNRRDLAMLLLCHRWVVSVSGLHSRRRSDCEQDVYDPCGGRKYSFASLPGSTASQDPVLLQVRRNAGTLHSTITSLSQIWRCACSSVDHIPIQQRHRFNNHRISDGKKDEQLSHYPSIISPRLEHYPKPMRLLGRCLRTSMI